MIFIALGAILRYASNIHTGCKRQQKNNNNNTIKREYLWRPLVHAGPHFNGSIRKHGHDLEQKNKSTLSNLLASHSEHSFILCTHFNSSISTLSFYRAQSEHSWKHRHEQKCGAHWKPHSQFLYRYIDIDVCLLDGIWTKKNEILVNEQAIESVRWNGNAPLLNVDPFRMSICSKWMLKSTVTRGNENEKKENENNKKKKEKKGKSHEEASTSAFAPAPAPGEESNCAVKWERSKIIFKVRRKVFTFELINLQQWTRNYEMWNGKMEKYTQRVQRVFRLRMCMKLSER